jgi:hypothetical protein
MRARSLQRKAVADPFDLPVDEVGDVAEPHRFELPRSPRAHVSEIVPAIDDDGAVLVQLCGRGLVQGLEGNVDGTGEVLLVVRADCSITRIRDRRVSSGSRGCLCARCVTSPDATSPRVPPRVTQHKHETKPNGDEEYNHENELRHI